MEMLTPIMSGLHSMKNVRYNNTFYRKLFILITSKRRKCSWFRSIDYYMAFEAKSHSPFGLFRKCFRSGHDERIQVNIRDWFTNIFIYIYISILAVNIEYEPLLLTSHQVFGNTTYKLYLPWQCHRNTTYKLHLPWQCHRNAILIVLSRSTVLQ